MILLLSSVVLLLGTVFLLGALPLSPERMEKRLRPVVWDGQEAALLSLAFDPEKTQSDLDAFLSGWDLGRAPLREVLLLEYVLLSRPGFSVPETLQPRLRGAVVFSGLHNEKLAGHLRKLGQALDDAGVLFVVLKGGAMLSYRPSFPRWMTDIDILVPVGDYERAVRTAMDLGYGQPMACDHSTDLGVPGEEGGCLDIHRYLEMGTGREAAWNDGLFARACRGSVGGRDVLVPSPEDLVFMEMVNLFKNISKDQARQSALATVFDIAFLAGEKPGFDWGLVREDAEKTGTLAQLYVVSRLLASWLPAVFPPEWMASPGIGRREEEACLSDLFLHRAVLSPARERFSETRLGASLRWTQHPLVRCWQRVVATVKSALGGRWARRILLRLRFLFDMR